jgi:hypothetical protein
VAALVLALVILPGASEAQQASAPANRSTVNLSLPNKEGSVRFAVIGDTGSGTEKQVEVAQTMVRYREAFAFDKVLMLGDNLYGSENAADYRKKFENIYKPLIDAQVKFYATLGNHDDPNQSFYKHFNMEGQEYYRLGDGPVSFYSLNSNYLDERQLKWLEDELSRDTAKWKIAFFHHPPYSSGKQHGSDTELRETLEPLFLRHGIDMVLAGHEHFYERIKPQKGISYFISGAGGKLRPDGLKKSSPLTEKSYDKDMHFMLMEVVDDSLYFQVISRTGETIDSGMIVNPR